ncbi:MAG: phosphoadenylyl-sulfate reductase [Bacteroidetes bacterium]|nr:phosphoadenylyl-sulfate reductase [Bacteroidota bacterium]
MADFNRERVVELANFIISSNGNTSYLDEINNILKDQNIDEILKCFYEGFTSTFTMASSYGPEDQVLVEKLSAIDKNISIFTIDTGRLFQETYNLFERTNEVYGIKIKVFFPNNELVEKMVNTKGINLFYLSIENRKECCHIRKIEPLKRALNGNKIWVTGLRSEQSITRINTSLIEWDAENQVIKLNPLKDWTDTQVWDYIKLKNIPFNKLHNQNLPSIGCLPCTRAISEGEDVRAGRWWWEQPEHKECGLHNRPIK